MRPQRGKKNAGFTLMETLVVVAILAILLAVSMVGIGAYKNNLKMSELDNAARAIYMAAQNHAIPLRNRGRLEKLTKKEDGSNKLNSGAAELYYVSSEDAQMKEELLPDDGSVDPSLYDGKFYIVYEPSSGSVTDVFYASETFAAGSFQNFYQSNRGKNRNDRMRLNPMVGYYGGELAGSGDALTLRTPVINIYNEDILRAEITWWIPLAVEAEKDKIALDVTLEYEGQKLALSEKYKAGDASGRAVDTEDKGSVYLTCTRTYLLDSLMPGQQFRDLDTGEAWRALAFGGNFKITAEVKDTGSKQKLNGASKTVEDNSLFARREAGEEDAGDTVYIACMRHLQNLHPEFSGLAVTGKALCAVQTADIDNALVPGTDGVMETWSFRPVQNTDLTSYDGAKYEIRNLLCEMSGTEETAGLFGVFGGPEAEGAQLKGVRLVNPRIGAAGAQAVGALCGRAENVQITDCQAYYESSAEETANLQGLLGVSDGSGRYALEGKPYQIAGMTAGGLLGTAKNCTVRESLAAATVSGSAVAGGLIGQAENVQIEKSYADCYLAGPYASGMVGVLYGNGNTLKGSYTAGFISLWPDGGTGDGAAAGLYLCGDGEGAAVTSCCAAMGYSAAQQTADGKNLYGNRYPLGQKGSYEKTHYLYTARVNGGQTDDAWHGLELYYKDIANLSSTNINTAFGSGVFVKKDLAHTNAYNLQEGSTLGAYPYPSINGLDHYGDWGASEDAGVLAYWENYADAEEVGLKRTKSGTGAFTVNTLKTDLPVTADGYGVLVPAERLDGDGMLQIHYTVSEKQTDGTMVENTYTVDYTTAAATGAGEALQSVTAGDRVWYLARMPEALVNTESAVDIFYQRMRITLEQSNFAEDVCYNPHFADTVQEEDGKTIPDSTLLSRAKSNNSNRKKRVRSARQLYQLSIHPEYYASENKYSFLQELDIDYASYTGYELFADGKKQSPIGTDRDHAFSGTYDGDCNGRYHTIANVPLDSSGSAVGLFGYNAGTVQNITYLTSKGGTEPAALNLDAGQTAVGMLAAVNMNTGAINNVVYLGSADPSVPFHLAVNAAAGVQTAAGSFVGLNEGNVTNCAAAYLTLDMKAGGSLFGGGFAGVNNGEIQSCSAAPDYIKVEADGDGTAYIGGFAGQNGSGKKIQCAYAVGKIELSGGSTSVCAGFVGSGSDNNSGITKSYSAVNLRAQGGAGVYGFCAQPVGDRCYYLNTGNYRYLDEEFSAQYADPKAIGTSWSGFTTGSIPSGMARNGSSDKYKGEKYPLPAVVTDKSGQRIHYGDWPSKFTAGHVGVFYWEKEVKYNTEGEQVGAPVYGYSLIDIDTDTGDMTLRRELCEEHDDGGVIEEYGYGYCHNYGGEKKQPALSAEHTLHVENEHNEAAESELTRQWESWMYGCEVTAYTTAKRGGGTMTALDGDFTSDAWNIESVGNTYSFRVNPFFAETFIFAGMRSVNGQEFNLKDVNEGKKGAEKVPLAADGAAPECRVRSAEQLRYINWNYETQNTETLLWADNRGQFPYLSYYNGGGGAVKRTYRFLQTHDLEGAKGENGKYLQYTPIAGVCNAGENKLWGWFGGTYDGQGYVIRELNIYDGWSKEGDRSASCVGLFGAAVDAVLQNIVLYSPSGEAMVRTGTPGWYAMGTLAGFAAQTEDGAAAITNCASAGYTLTDRQYEKVEKKLARVAAVSRENAAIGGLVGLCGADLTRCSAVNKISLQNGERDFDVERTVCAGGLAGAGQCTVSLSYSGGEIAIRQEEADGEEGKKPSIYYAGGIIGGAFLKRAEVDTADGEPLYIKAGTEPEKISNTVQNCYSYTVLPLTDHAYAIGGAADCGEKATSYMATNYYLKDLALKHYAGADALDRVLDVDGEEAAGSRLITGLSYQELSAQWKSKKLLPVSDFGNTAENCTYPANKNFTGDYPFPAVIRRKKGTQEIYVHYGNWPQDGGLLRNDSEELLEIDLFADYPKEPEAGAAISEGTSGAISGTPEARRVISIQLSEALRERLKEDIGDYILEVECVNTVRGDLPGGGDLVVDSAEDTAGDGSGENSGGGTGESLIGGEDEGAQEEIPVARAGFLLPDGTTAAVMELDASNAEEIALAVTGISAGTAQIRVNLEQKLNPKRPNYGGAIVTFPLDFTLQVTTELKLLPVRETTDEGGAVKLETLKEGETVRLLAGGTSRILLYAADKNGELLPEELCQKIGDLVPEKITLVPDGNIESAVLSQVTGSDPAAAPEEGGTAALPCRFALDVKALNAAERAEIGLEYQYTYNEKTYQGGSVVASSVSEALLTAGTSVEIDLDSAEGAEEVRIGWEQISLTIDGKAVQLDELQDKMLLPGETTDTGVMSIAMEAGDNMIAMLSSAQDGTMVVQAFSPGTVELPFVMQFTWQGCGYTLLAQVIVEVIGSTLPTAIGLEAIDGLFFEEELELADEGGLEFSTEPADEGGLEFSTEPADEGGLEFSTEPAFETGTELSTEPTGEDGTDTTEGSVVWTDEPETEAQTQTEAPTEVQTQTETPAEVPQTEAESAVEEAMPETSAVEETWPQTEAMLPPEQTIEPLQEEMGEAFDP